MKPRSILSVPFTPSQRAVLQAIATAQNMGEATLVRNTVIESIFTPKKRKPAKRP